MNRTHPLDLRLDPEVLPEKEFEALRSAMFTSISLCNEVLDYYDYDDYGLGDDDEDVLELTPVVPGPRRLSASRKARRARIRQAAGRSI